MPDKKQTPDDFWDLSSLLPKKRPPVMRQYRPDTSTAEINIDVPDNISISSAPSGSSESAPTSAPTSASSISSLSARFREVSISEIPIDHGISEKTYSDKVTDKSRQEINISLDIPAPSHSPSHSHSPSSASPRSEERRTAASETVDEYTADYGLIRHVKITRWHSNYNFYEHFRKYARMCYDVKGTPSPRVEFFSYTPQYRQMTKDQLNFYFYWRSLARKKEYIPADFSYILLYVYEIINLHDIIDPTVGISELCGIWIHYRENYKPLDKYLSEWIADYCLLHRMKPPTKLLSPIMYAVLESTSFREFYMDRDILDPETLIALSSNYIWQKSKYVSDPEKYSLYSEQLPRALGYVISHSGGNFSVTSMSPARVSRDAFCGSLCAQNIKRRIDVEYLSYSKSTDLRSLITNIVKYSENRLRAHLGIKSRLRVDGLEDRFKHLIDEYFSLEYPNDKKRFPKVDEAYAEQKYYDSMYGALSHGIDTEAARELEKASWSVTDRLTADETTDETIDETSDEIYTFTADKAVSPREVYEAPPSETPKETPSGTTYVTLPEITSASATLSPLHVEVLRAVCGSGSSPDLAAICRNSGRYLDDIISEINEYAVDTIGDIIIESNPNGGFSAIEDYEEEISEILKKYE